MHDLRRSAGPSDLGRGEAGAAVGRAYLLAKQSCIVQGAAGGCKERDEARGCSPISPFPSLVPKEPKPEPEPNAPWTRSDAHCVNANTSGSDSVIISAGDVSLE